MLQQRPTDPHREALANALAEVKKADRAIRDGAEVAPTLVEQARLLGVGDHTRAALQKLQDALEAYDTKDRVLSKGPAA